MAAVRYRISLDIPARTEAGRGAGAQSVFSRARSCAFQKFDDEADFRTVEVPGGTQYTVLTFSPAKTIGGNATTSEVPADAFPS
ncbi:MULTISPECIES: hypothetical protein [unclassified Streptomyces]|uniref:hypothetical protein n=1 Tax=unclassified Streptomyces TaxID=2593676 RepID=UPI00380BEB78